MLVERRSDPDGGERADDVLALTADVEEPAAERERDGEAGEDQCGRQQEGLLQVYASCDLRLFVFRGNQTVVSVNGTPML